MEKHIPNETAGVRNFSEFETIAHQASILDNAPGFVYSIDTNWRLISINLPLKKALHESGLTISPGDSTLDFVEALNPTLAEEWKRVYARAFAGQSFQFVREFNLVKKTFWEFVFNPIKDDDKVKEIACFIRDVTNRELRDLQLKEVQQSLLKSQANMRHILDNSDTACLLLDKDFKILAANRLANEWALSEIGITLVDGEDFLIHFPEMYKPLAGPVLQKVMGGMLHSYEAKYTKRDQTVNWYHVRLAPVFEKGEIIGLCIVASDTTRNKSAEAEIKLLNDSLERKVKERTAELEEANKELEAFTYSVSHDLLSPLRNIDSFIDILIEDYRNKLNDDGQYTLSVIKRNSTLMGRLIADLLNFARFAKMPLRKQMVNMETTVNEVIDELRFMTNKLAAKITLNDVHPAYCDPQLIKQVWVNLLSNAIKYSNTKDAPEIQIGSTEEDGQIVYFIKDNGVGFDMQQADKLFGVFQRLHRSNEFEGTGVGLAIVHRIVTKHGGRIWAESMIGEGTTFHFTL
jgi:signal transduction histidine kinase